MALWNWIYKDLVSSKNIRQLAPFDLKW